MHNSYDVVVLGAGINGCAIARALASKGKSVLVLDKGKIGCGASSHSSRLIHGGLRYLEQLDFPLVYEALHDRQLLLERYGDLVELVPFYLPVYEYSERPAWMIRTGLWFYDLLSRFAAPHKRIGLEAFTTLFPRIKAERLRAVYCYYDGKTDDLALTQRIAAEAQAYGVQIRQGCEVEGIETQEESFILHLDNASVRTSTLINATGAWIDEVNGTFSLPSRYHITKVSGIHLVLEGLLVAHPLFLQTGGKRIFFMIPEPQNRQTLIGTTERVEEGPCDEVAVDEADVEYLINEANRYFQTPICREDVQRVFIGVRPLIYSKKDPTDLSREYKLDLHKMGKKTLMHVYGGKITTFWSLSQHAARTLENN